MQSTSTNFNQKYADLVNEKNFYRLLLSVKTELRKLAKKDTKEFFNILIWCTGVLKDNSESESCIALNLYSIDELEKSFSKADTELCLESFKKAFLATPSNLEKSKLKHRLLKFFESKNISDILLLTHEYYQVFANDALINKDIMEGYRYALKSQDFSTIVNYVDVFTTNQLQNEAEKSFFIARICLELLLMKNLSLGLKFISNYTDPSENLQKNHPIINFAYLIVALFCKDASNFDNFWAFINIYRPVLMTDPSFTKYLNKISMCYFNKAIIQEEGGMNLMNILRAFSN